MVVCWFWQKFQFSKIGAKEAKTQIGPFVFFVFFAVLILIVLSYFLYLCMKFTNQGYSKVLYVYWL